MDYLQDLLRRDISQAVILQMTSYFKEALDVYDRKVEFLQRVGAPKTQINKFILLRGDAYRLNEDYEEAERDYKSVEGEEDELVAKVHLLELYLKKGDQKKADMVQEELERGNILKKLRGNQPDEYFKAEYFMGLSLVKQNRCKEALKKFKTLQNEAAQHYNHRFEGIPVVHDIFRGMANCESMLHNYK